MKRVEFRRKREGKTDYKKRLNLLLNEKPRLIIRKSLKNMTIQLIEYNEKGDKILVSADSKELEKKFEWKAGRTNLPAAYLTGYLVGKKAAKKGIKCAILDIGLGKSIKGGRLYASLKGVLDAGLNVPCSEDIFPSEDAVKGVHIANYAQKLIKEGKYEKIFSSYVKKGIKAEDIPKYFEETKKKID
ncbi:50S ribosomal protein L18 [Candidatus Woesearchaeota archaeon B3_Woes]|nr:MAG: 50S ribosomal protein L18 [Candidatus Woesearchaeota archaeon B3_Woes]